MYIITYQWPLVKLWWLHGHVSKVVYFLSLIIKTALEPQRYVSVHTQYTCIDLNETFKEQNLDMQFFS